MLPGPLQRGQLQGLCQELLCVLPLQGAGVLPVWLLRWPIADQRGQTERWPLTAALPVRVRRLVRVAQLYAGDLRPRRQLSPAGSSARGGGQVSACVCVLQLCHLLRFVSAFLKTSPILFFRKSFFSGHASFAMYTMLYLAVSIFFIHLSACLLAS